MKFAFFFSPRICYRTIVSFALIGLTLLIWASLELAAQEPEANRILLEGTTMGPIKYHVAVANPPTGLDSKKLQTEVENSMGAINRLMSTYQADSDVCKFNRQQSTEWFAVDAETAKVVRRALELSELSEGAFDITVAPVVNRWKFGPSKDDSDFKIPTADELQSMKAIVGYRKIQVRDNPPALKKSKPGTSIDLSAIAKGYAVDVVGTTLEKFGCRNYMVEIGGETVVKGKRATGGNWRIGIQKPDELIMEQAQEILALTDCAIATSGDYRNYRAIRGKRYSHTIDPRTCAPVVNRVASATVIAKDCMTADGVATALMVMGPEGGLELCHKMGLEALIKVRDEEFGDNFAEFKTANFTVNSNQTTTALAAESQVKPAAFWPVFVAALIVFTLAVLAGTTGAIFSNKSVDESCCQISNRGAGDSVGGVCSKPLDQCPIDLAESTRKNTTL